MQEQDQSQRNFGLRPWGVVLLGSLALSALVQVVGAASLPASIRGIQDQRMAAKDETRFVVDASGGRAANPQPDGPGRSDLVQPVQFMQRPEFADGPMPALMGPPPPLPGEGPGLPSRSPPRFAPRTGCLEDINRQMAVYGYVRSKLQITESQQAAAKAVDEALQSSVAKLQALCQTLPNEPAPPPGLMQRADVLERQLAARLDLLRALKAPMQELVALLGPDQRAVLDAPMPFRPF
jgi:hypothetical protein